MPQLMPLNWMFSSSMMVLLIFSACVIYSGAKSEINEVNLMKTSSNNYKNLWLW